MTNAEAQRTLLASGCTPDRNGRITRAAIDAWLEQHTLAVDAEDMMERGWIGAHDEVRKYCERHALPSLLVYQDTDRQGRGMTLAIGEQSATLWEDGMPALTRSSAVRAMFSLFLRHLRTLGRTQDIYFHIGGDYADVLIIEPVVFQALVNVGWVPDAPNFFERITDPSDA